MKFVGDTLSFSRVDGDEAHTVRLPFYHRAAVGIFPGTRLFAVPLPTSNELVLTPIDPSTWGDLWRLEATVADQPGAAKTLVETLVDNNVNVLIHEGVSESAEQGDPVHQIFEVLDLRKYENAIDRDSEHRSSAERSLLKPNRLINRLIGHSTDCLIPSRDRDGWELRFERMEFFFRNKGAREHGIVLRLDVNNEVHIPATVFHDMKFVKDATKPMPLHIISDTEQKYVKLRVLSPAKYYLLLEIEHAERVGAIDEFMSILRAHEANMIDSYSRLKSFAQSALFYALAEFPSRKSAGHVLDIVTELLQSPPARNLVLKGAAGAGPTLPTLEPELPERASIRAKARRRSAPTTEPGLPKSEAAAAVMSEASSFELGAPYYLDRPRSDAWRLKTAQVFMAVPFSKPYKVFYRDVIASAVRDVGLEPVRVDELPADGRHRPIVDSIEREIARSRFVIADMSGWNPNVVYEVGLAVGISKRILLLCDDENFDERIPFDFRSYPLVQYTLYEARELRSQLTVKVREMKERTERPDSEATD